jgi:hydroxypyruvate reductase
MKPEILALAPMIQPCMTALEHNFIVHRLWEAQDRASFLATVGSNIRAIVTNGALGANSSLIAALPKLEIIATYGVGVDAIDLALAKRRGIAVTNTPDVLTDDVADMALALLLATARRIVFGDNFVRTGQWSRGEMPLTRRVNGKAAGILGLGRIGTAVAKRLEGLNMRISYNSRKKSDVPFQFHENLAEMASEVDFLIVTAAGGEGTRKIVNREVLEALGPNGILVNVSRGTVVDEEALVLALKEGKLGGAGLDVFASEPNVPEELKSMPNVVLQPHQGSGTIEGRTAMGDLVVGNLVAHFSGKPLITQLKY